MRRRSRLARTATPLLIASAALVVGACGVNVAGTGQGGGGGYDRPSLALTTTLRPASATSHDASVGEPQLLEGVDFTLRYPGDASLRPLELEAAPGATSAIEIRGPELRDVEGDPIEGSATYTFEVVTYPNAEGLPLDAWLSRHRERENAHDALRASGRGGAPAATPPTSAAVGGVPALRESRFGGDCELVRYYVARGSQVVALRFADYPVESDSLNPENLRTYQKLLGGFRWRGGATGA